MKNLFSILLKVLGVAALCVVVYLFLHTLSEADTIINQYEALTGNDVGDTNAVKIAFLRDYVQRTGDDSLLVAIGVTGTEKEIIMADLGESEGADPEDDRQNSDGDDPYDDGGNGNGNGNGDDDGDDYSDDDDKDEGDTDDFINGKVLTLPDVGELVWYKEVNNKSNEGFLPRLAPDIVNWEFAFGWVTSANNKDYNNMKKRANKIAGSVVNPNENAELRVNLNGTEYYVGCLPIADFGKLGDLVQFNFSDGSSIKLLAIDEKAKEDPAGSSGAGVANTKVGHGAIKSDGIRLNELELWCGGNKTKDSKHVVGVGKVCTSVEIIGHSNIFD